MFPLIVISSDTPEVDIKQELHWAERFIEMGVFKYHFRKPQWSIDQQKEFAELMLCSFNKEQVAKMKIHTTLTDSIHFETLNLHFKGEVKVDDVKTSRSFHSVDSISENHGDFEYGFLSPIFDSISKSKYFAKFDSEELMSSRELFKSKKIFALGGLSLRNLEEAKELGFYGGALLGAIWNSGAPEANLKEFLELSSKGGFLDD